MCRVRNETLPKTDEKRGLMHGWMPCLQGELVSFSCSCAFFSFYILEACWGDEHQIDIEKSCETQKFIFTCFKTCFKFQNKNVCLEMKILLLK